MSTGYTYIIEKRDVSLKEFALRCARNFGALIGMRDLDLGAVIPDRFEVDSYYLDRQQSALADVARLEAMTSETVVAGAHEAYVALVIDVLISNAKSAVLKQKYQRLLNDVTAWEPPTNEHARLKQFMIEQLTESMQWDCYCRDWPKQLTPIEWHELELSEARRRATSAAEDCEKEKHRVAARNEWLTKLRASLE